jgi:putative phosphoribosyl transferase
MTPLEGRTVIVVDDGIATGSTARAALRVARAHGAHRVVLAVPVAPPGTAEAFADDADEVVIVEQPERMWAIGTQYADFRQTTDAEVVALLAETPLGRDHDHFA